MNAARDHCSILQTTQEDYVKYVIIGDGSMRNRVVQWCIKDIFWTLLVQAIQKYGNSIPPYYFDIVRGKDI
jgi:hypothetical protein